MHFIILQHSYDAPWKQACGFQTNYLMNQYKIKNTNSLCAISDVGFSAISCYKIIYNSM